MRTCYLLLACWLVTAVAFAQAPSPASPSSLAAPPAPQADTVAAIHRLFAAKRKRRLPIILITVGVAAAGSAVLAASASSAFLDDRAIAAALLAIGIIPAVGVELGYYSTFSHKAERRAIEELRLHQLSRHTARMLVFDNH